MRSVNVLTLSVALAISAAAHSQTPPTPAPAEEPAASPSGDTAIIPARVEGVATVGDLARLQSQVMMAEARKKLAEAQRGASGEASAAPVESAGSADPQAAAGQGGVSRRTYETPIIVGIHGSASSPYALVRVSDATVVSVRVGDSIPGGWTVQAVKPDGVTVRGAGGQRTLGFSAAVEEPQAPAARR